MTTKPERLVRLILLLQARNRICAELGDVLEVSRRTVMRDVEALGRLGVPVVSRSGPGGHYEMPGDQTLRPLELTGSEAFLLMLALDALERLTDVPFAPSRETLAAKVRALLPEAQADRAHDRLDKVQIQVPKRLPRATQLSRLTEHCDRWVELRYLADGGEATYICRVEKVFADSGFWYLEVLVEGKRRNLRADRVIEVKPAEEPAQVNEAMPYGDPSHPLVQVELSAKGLRNLERDPHLGHLAHDRKAPFVLEFRCPPEELHWFARYFGGMGRDARVAGPPELLALLVCRAREQLVMYEEA